MVEIFIIIGLILLNGLLSMSEIALVSARKSRLEGEAKRGSKSAKTALALADDPNRFLSTIQIGITLIGILTGLYSGEAFSQDFAKVIAEVGFLEPYSLVIAKTVIVIVVTYLTLVLGELAPKTIGMTRAESVSKLAARPMDILSRIAAPFVWLLSKSTALVIKLLGVKDDDSSKVTEEDIRAIVREGVDVGEVEEVEQDIVERVFTLGDRDVGSIMTHRRDLVWLNIGDDRETITKKVMEEMHEVYPVGETGMDSFIGVVFLKDLFGRIDETDFKLEKLISPANYIPENQSVYRALERMRAVNSKYGFVVDEFGDIEGIITFKDILKALVGDVAEEDGESDIFRREDGSLLVDGQCLFYDFLEYMDLQELYYDYEYNTLSGLIINLLDRIPHTGDKVHWHKMEFEIVDMDGARIDKVLVTKQKKKEKEKDREKK